MQTTSSFNESNHSSKDLIELAESDVVAGNSKVFPELNVTVVETGNSEAFPVVVEIVVENGIESLDFMVLSGYAEALIGLLSSVPQGPTGEPWPPA